MRNINKNEGCAGRKWLGRSGTALFLIGMVILGGWVVRWGVSGPRYFAMAVVAMERPRLNTFGHGHHPPEPPGWEEYRKARMGWIRGPAVEEAVRKEEVKKLGTIREL